MKKQHSRIGLVSSLVIHGTLIGGGFLWLDNHKEEKFAEEQVMSMEMVAALLEQPQVAVAPEPEEEKEVEKEEAAPEPEEKPEPKPEPEAVPDPILKPKPEKKEEKPKEEKRKEHRHHHKHHKHHKDDEKPKEKPKERPKDPKPIKALERGPEVKQGIVAKAIPNAVEGPKVVAGVVGGQKNGSQSSTATSGSTNGSNSGGNPNEIANYKAQLQKALQRRANNSYPQREKMMRKTGTVTIKFSVSPSGQITNVSVVSSSGNDNLDAAATRSAEGLQMPPPPAGFPAQVSAPVRFSIE